jgi:CHAD domain-containing protein
MRSLAAVPPRGPVLSPDDAGRIAVPLVFRFHVQRFRDHEPGARAGDVEGVHQLRVATRRMRATLRLFRPILPSAFVTGMERDLAWLAATIGAVRDRDVLGQQVNAAATRVTVESRRALGPVALAIHDERRTRHDALVGALDSPRARRVVDRLGGLAGSSGGNARLGTVAPELIRPLLRTVLRAGRGVTPESPPASLHRLRVRVKRLRYALETLRALGGKDVARTIRRLARLQDLLGVSQDGAMAIEWLRGYAETDAPRATLVAVGALVEALARRVRKARRRFPDAWEKLDRRGLRAALLRELADRRRPAPAGEPPSPRALPETGS